MASITLTRIEAHNLLSFGPEGIDLELPALTVLIGPNGSGKSNVLETVGLLRGAPSELASPIREGGGIRNWIWHGDRSSLRTASVEATLGVGLRQLDMTHMLRFADVDQHFVVMDENIRVPTPTMGDESAQVTWQRRIGTASRKSLKGDVEEEIDERKVDIDKSILSEIKDPVQFPELSRISYCYGGIGIYRRWNLAPKLQSGSRRGRT